MAGAIDPLVRFYIGTDRLPDEETKNKFIGEANDGMANPDYHLYGDMYALFLRSMLIIDIWSRDASLKSNNDKLHVREYIIVEL